MRHGSQIDPPNRFERVATEADFEALEPGDELFEAHLNRRVEYLEDHSRSIVNKIDSPDIPIRYSVNPYRGCVHGCAYCYARQTHEYLGLNAGLDFETRVLVKHRAPELLREFLARDRWRCEPIFFSGVTDCYQPVERRLRLTRRCLEVAAACRQPVGIVTKNALVARDLDVLAPMAAGRLANVSVSVTTLDAELARTMEPRTSTPAARLRTVEQLAAAGVPVRVMMAPIIPGLNDHEMAEILAAARDAGATDAAYVLLRLPLTVEPVFREWLRRTHPDHADKVEGRIRRTRGGNWYDATPGKRMVGAGPIAEGIRTAFAVFRRKNGFADLPPLDTGGFRPPQPSGGQLRLF